LPRAQFTRLLAFIAVLALALAAPAALARTHRAAACAGRVAPRSGHAAHACTHTPKTTKPHSRRRKGSAGHIKRTRRHAHARALRQAALTQAASCEDGSAPLVAGGEATCADGSEPTCEDGSEPFAGAAGMIVCPTGEDGQRGAEASCDSEACAFDSEGNTGPEEAVCEACQAAAGEADG
jgi:hypothetical protein